MLVAGALLVGCGSAADPKTSAPRAAKLARWHEILPSPRPLDLASARLGRTVVMEAAGRLWLVTFPGAPRAIDPRYRSPGGEEPYIAIPASTHRGCSFGGGTIYAIKLTAPRGIWRIGPRGELRRFASITAGGLIDGVAFDETGAFGYRLLVTINHGQTTTVDALDCRGRVSTLTTDAPRVEGGIAVAPSTFGRFAGDLIAPDETGGRVFAISPVGRAALLANSGLPHGGDIGVESEGFVPHGYTNALLADRLTPGNRHPGDDVLLELSAGALRSVAVRPGDLLVATEGGAKADDIRCGASRCTVRHVADGPPEAHAEGHIAFVR
jgi:hypothetical protein